MFSCLCFKVRNPIISIDGNFGLVRKGHSGRSLEGPKITGSFLDDDAVKGFVQRVDDGKKKTKSVRDITVPCDVFSCN